MLKDMAYDFLKLAESIFLRTYGWQKVGKDEWMPPKDYDARKKGIKYRGGHAVNSQKYSRHSLRRLGNADGNRT